MQNKTKINFWDCQNGVKPRAAVTALAQNLHCVVENYYIIFMAIFKKVKTRHYKF